jgi:transcriptional regulator with PAS, ATPase and Fis domain
VSPREVLIGKDPVFKAALALARRAAPGTSPLLLVGPMGSGKSHLARWIHNQGAHPDTPYLEWHASGVPEQLLESDILGMEAGAATDVAARPGICERVGEGTLCLTGLELMPLRQQAILLRIIEEHGVYRVGGQSRRPVKARFLAAFQESPDSLVAQGRLRRDLLYRLDVIRIELPPLGMRRGDVPLLLAHFLKALRGSRRRPAPKIEPSLFEALEQHPWPGNLLELRQLAEALEQTGADPLKEDDLPPSFWLRGEAVQQGITRRMTLAELKDSYIRQVLAKVGGNRTRAAEWLGISRKALWEYLKRESP